MIQVLTVGDKIVNLNRVFFIVIDMTISRWVSICLVSGKIVSAHGRPSIGYVWYFTGPGNPILPQCFGRVIIVLLILTFFSSLEIGEEVRF